MSKLNVSQYIDLTDDNNKDWEYVEDILEEDPIIYSESDSDYQTQMLDELSLWILPNGETYMSMYPADENKEISRFRCTVMPKEDFYKLSIKQASKIERYVMW